MIYLVNLGDVRRPDGRVSRRRRARAVRQLAGVLPAGSWLQHPDRVCQPGTPTAVNETVLVVHSGDLGELEAALTLTDCVDWFTEARESSRGWPYGPYSIRGSVRP